MPDNQIIDTALLSGSADTLRTAMGGYWYTADSEYGTNINFSAADMKQPKYEYFTKIYLPDKNGSIESEIIDSHIPIPGKRFPIRIAGSGELVKDDVHWRAVVLGGTYGENSYTSIYNETVFQYLDFKNNKPYPKTLATEIYTAIANVVPEIEISYDYSDYLALYEGYVKGLDSELLIPNYYILADLTRHDFASHPAISNVYPNELINFVTLEGQYEGFISEIFDFNASNIIWSEHDPGGIQNAKISFTPLVQRNTNLSIQYLTSSLIQNPLSVATTNWVKNKFQTLLFDQEAIENISALDKDYQECFPYKIKINFPQIAADEYVVTSTTTAGGEVPTDFFESINENNFSSKFIKTLYETFANKPGAPVPINKNYTDYSNYITVSGEEADNVTNTSLREIDYIKFLCYCYNSHTNTNPNCMFVGDNNLYRLAATSGKDTYRHINTQTTVGVLSDTIDFISNPDNVGVTQWDDLYGSNKRYTETLAYRVEKIGGPGSGDNKTQNVLQNFWFINSSQMPEFEFFDTQVKFDTEYTYKVYAYVLTVGIKYNTTDLRLTRQLGCEDENVRVGLEFYDPFSVDDETATRLFTGLDAAGQPFDDTFGGEFGEGERIYSSVPFLADFYLNYEPTVKIVEIPLYSKTLRVLDNPTNRLNIAPYQTLDSSNRIGFDFTYNAFSEKTFPSIINKEDQTYKQNYMHAQDLLEGAILLKESTSKPRYLEIYRLSERPLAIADFDNNLVTTLDLKIGNSKHTNRVISYEDRVRENKKYYYLFRVLNEHRNLSHLTEIYEAQLINDGGYPYTVFNVIFESELKEEIFNNPSNEFKKLFQLQPNLSQLQFNTDNVDFNQSAGDQIGNLQVGTADDLIWDKTFKVRLTSKKTGRKIDLNITYYLNSE